MLVETRQTKRLLEFNSIGIGWKIGVVFGNPVTDHAENKVPGKGLARYGNGLFSKTVLNLPDFVAPKIKKIKLC